MRLGVLRHQVHPELHEDPLIHGICHKGNIPDLRVLEVLLGGDDPVAFALFTLGQGQLLRTVHALDVDIGLLPGGGEEPQVHALPRPEGKIIAVGPDLQRIVAVELDNGPFLVFWKVLNADISVGIGIVREDVFQVLLFQTARGTAGNEGIAQPGDQPCEGGGVGTLFHLVLAGKGRHIFQGRGIRQLCPLRGDVIALQGVLLPGFLPGRGLLARVRGLGRLCGFRRFRGFRGLGGFRGFRRLRGLGRLGFFRRLGDFRRFRLLRGVQRLVLAVFGAASGPGCPHAVAQGHIPLIQKVHFNAADLRQIVAEGNGQASFLVIQLLLGVAGVQELVLNAIIGRHHKVVALSGGKGPVRDPVVDVHHCLGLRLLHLGGQPGSVPGVCGAHHRDHGQHHGQRQQQTENSSAHIVFLL